MTNLKKKGEKTKQEKSSTLHTLVGDAYYKKLKSSNG